MISSAQSHREGTWKALEAATANSRAIGGVVAEPGKWPSMVALLLQRPGQGTIQFCGGTVISREWVLTAAHCAAAMREIKGNVTFFIREGTVDLTSKTGNTIKVTEILPFEGYKPEITLNDIALLRLAQPARSPRQKLAGERDQPVLVVPNRVGTVTGFGRTAEGGNASTVLRQVDLPVVAQPDCAGVYGQEAITSANFCAGFREGGKDSCQGDSGGPYFLFGDGGEVVQTGVVSWGKGCARKGFPGVYASVGTFETWIRSHVPDAVFVTPVNGPANVPPPVAAADEAVAPIVAGAGETSHPAANAQVTVDIDQGYQLKIGQTVTFRVLSSVAGRLLLVNQDVDGRAYQIFPSTTVPSGQPNGAVAAVKAGQTLTIPTARQLDQGFRFRIDPPAGKNRLIAIVVPNETRADDLLTRYADGRAIDDLPKMLAELAARQERVIVVEPPVAEVAPALVETATQTPKPTAAKPTISRAVAEREYVVVP
jgi:secreted trypsin-like serine protease